MRRILRLIVIILTLASSLLLLPPVIHAQSPANDYLVGPNYNSTTSATLYGHFLGRYHDPEMRNLVLSQLHTLADSGARVIKTIFWISGPGNGQYSIDRMFPPTDQELQNLRHYVQDVSTLKNPNGQYLDFYLGLAWNGCANYKDINVPCYHMSEWDYWLPLAKQTTDKLFAAIGDIARPDGQKAVQLFYAEGEVIRSTWDNGTEIKPNTDKFLTEYYPYFISVANQYGINPSVYFIVQSNDTEMFNNNYTNPYFPEINGRESLKYIYPTTRFMQAHNIPLPQRLDMSVYNVRTIKTQTEILDKMMDDLQAIYPNTEFGVAETFYFKDPAERLALGQAFVQSFLTRGNPTMLTFWDYSGDGSDFGSGPPFDIASFLPQGNQIGYLDETSCTRIRGWTGDLENPTSPLTVRLYRDGPAGGGGILFQTLTANLSRESAVCAALGSTESPCLHGYSLNTPNNLKDGQNHSIYAYGVVNLTGNGIPKLLTLSPISLNCPVPPGNLDNDTDIDFLDLSTFFPLFNTSNTSANFNGLGLVDVFDWNILLRNL